MFLGQNCQPNWTLFVALDALDWDLHWKLHWTNLEGTPPHKTQHLPYKTHHEQTQQEHLPDQFCPLAQQ